MRGKVSTELKGKNRSRKARRNTRRAFQTLVFVAVGSASLAGARAKHKQRPGGSASEMLDRTRKVVASSPSIAAASAARQLVQRIRLSHSKKSHAYLEAVRLAADVISRLDKPERLKEALNLYQTIVRIEKRSLGRAHPCVAQTRTRLALLHLRTGNAPDAFGEAAKSLKTHLINARRHLPRMSERGRARYLERMEPAYHLLLDILVLRSRAGVNRSRIRKALALVMSYKGFLMECRKAQLETLASRRHGRLRALDDTARKARQRLNVAVFRGPLPNQGFGSYHREVLDLRSKVESAERSLARGSAGHVGADRLGPVKFRTVRHRLGRRSTLVEFVRFRRTRLKGSRRTERRWHYAALMMRGGRSGKLAVHYLGPAHRVASLVRRYRRAMASYPEQGRKATRMLREMVWNRLVSAAPHVFHRKVVQVYVAPVGALNGVSFVHMATTSTGSVALHLRSIVRVRSGRDVSRQAGSSRRMVGRGAVVVIGPTNGPKGTDRAPWARNRTQTLRTLFRALKVGTVRVLKGTAATGNAVSSLIRPVVLHLHARPYRLPTGGNAVQSVWAGPATTTAARRGFAKGLFALAARRSGILLTRHDAAPSHGRSNAIQRYRFFSAEAVRTMDLRGTSLVVFTGRNAAPNVMTSVAGEVPFELARAALFAGARSVVTCLWKVPDPATRLFIRTFYRNLSAGRSKLGALQNARAQVQKRFSDPRSWAAWILLGHAGRLR